jgi:IS30 family transposase
MSITKIARQLGVNKSTVSRNMKAARHKLNRLLKYSFGRFTADAQADSPPLNAPDNCAPQRGQ